MAAASWRAVLSACAMEPASDAPATLRRGESVNEACLEPSCEPRLEGRGALSACAMKPASYSPANAAIPPPAILLCGVLVSEPCLEARCEPRLEAKFEARFEARFEPPTIEGQTWCTIVGHVGAISSSTVTTCSASSRSTCVRGRGGSSKLGHTSSLASSCLSTRLGFGSLLPPGNLRSICERARCIFES